MLRKFKSAPESTSAFWNTRKPIRKFLDRQQNISWATSFFIELYPSKVDSLTSALASKTALVLVVKPVKINEVLRLALT